MSVTYFRVDRQVILSVFNLRADGVPILRDYRRWHLWRVPLSARLVHMLRSFLLSGWS
jgi:hypothetical protein